MEIENLQRLSDLIFGPIEEERRYRLRLLRDALELCAALEIGMDDNILTWKNKQNAQPADGAALTSATSGSQDQAAQQG